jgi:hypothetical protein
MSDPKLSDSAEREWRTFVTDANWTVLHALDMERFYKFVIGTHRQGEGVTAPDVLALLGRVQGCTKDQADELANLYAHARALLVVYDTQ